MAIEDSYTVVDNNVLQNPNSNETTSNNARSKPSSQLNESQNVDIIESFGRMKETNSDVNKRHTLSMKVKVIPVTQGTVIRECKCHEEPLKAITFACSSKDKSVKRDLTPT